MTPKAQDKNNDAEKPIKQSKGSPSLVRGVRMAG